MNWTTPVTMLLVGSLIGVCVTLYMLADAIWSWRNLAQTADERNTTYRWMWQWGLGWLIKLLFLFFSLWALFLPPAGQRPDTALERWAVAHARFIIVGVWVVAVYLMDARDVVLASLKIKDAGLMGLDSLRNILHMRRSH